MNRESSMIVTMLLAAKVAKDGTFPRDADVKHAFDTTELIMRESILRADRFDKIEEEAHRDRMNRRAKEPVGHGG
jgi:hypothetical protein